jgi:guanine deaminase
MVSYSLSENAYLKIFFHAAKHPHLPVNGVLLGRRTSDVVVIEDVIPLLHHWTSLSPMMEIGLDLVRQSFYFNATFVMVLTDSN